FVAHRGEDRALSRVIFAPIAVALMSVYASTHVAGLAWAHSFGLGGLFGDTVLGAILGIAPVSATLGLKLLAFLVGMATVAMALFVLGFDRDELKATGRFLLLGTVVAYDGLMRALGRGAAASIRSAQALADRRREAALSRADESAALREMQLTDAAVAPRRAAQVLRADARYGEPAGVGHAPVAEPARERRGLLARVAGLARRSVEPDYPADPEPELIEPRLSRWAATADAPSEDRIRARIADAVKSRAGTPAAPRSEPPLTAGLRAEPPLSAALQAARATAGPLVAPGNVFAADTAPFDPAEEDFGLNAFADLDEDDDEGPAMPRAAAGSARVQLSPRKAPAPPEQALAEAQPRPRLGAAAAPSAPTAEASALNAFADLDEDDAEGPAMPRAAAGSARVPLAPRKAPAPSKQALAEAQPRLRFDDAAPAYEIPPLSLLASPASVQRRPLSNEALEENARMLESVLDDYGVKGEITSVRPGPVVTMYELEPAPGLKASRVIGLADDIARSMSALSARVSTVPGRTVIGIELPNAFREKVVLREILSAREYGDSGLRLPLALGKDIAGDPVVANLAKMPHLLIAGTTGSGKSVAINTMILSLLYKLTPEECRLIMIDPKMLELSVYDGIPHLLSPVVTDPRKAVVALKWVVGEMEERYRKMSKMGVRNIEGYNGRVREALAKGEMFKRTVQTGVDEETGDPVFETADSTPVALPSTAVIVDEMADLMMVAGKEIEACIQRLAQMARASGIHLIMATQRPSVDVITGTIKANFPTRISFQVTSKIDSRTILGEMGAEQLLGQGDMLYMAGGSRITRVHGPFVSDEEVEEIVTHLKSFGPPEYMSGVVEGHDDETGADIDMVLGLGGDGSED